MKKSILQQINYHLSRITENYPADNEDLNNANFNSFYVRQKKSKVYEKIISLLEKLSLIQASPFLPSKFLKLINQTIFMRDNNEPECVDIQVCDATRLIVFGDLHGAAHSLGRMLNELVERDFLDESLKLKNEHDFCIFNGNLIGNSHTNLETIIMVLNLLIYNPKNIIWLQGKNEQLGDWRNCDLKNALMERCKNLNNDLIPCETLIDTLIGTFPKEICIKFPHHNSYIAYNRPSINTILDNNINSLIVGRERTFDYSLTNGLELLHSEGGALQWSQFSAPSYVNQQLFNFYYDAFCILNCIDFKYTLYNRDVRTTNSFQKQSFNFLTGTSFSKEDSSKDKTKIVIGVTMDLSETASVLGMRLRDGIECATQNFNDYNNKLNISPIFLNDKYTPFLSTINIKRFQQKFNTDIIFSPLGTPTTASCLPLVIAKEILVLFPYSGANIFRQPHLDYMVHLRASYASEARALIKYADEELKLKRFAFFYQNDSYGLEPLNAAIEHIQSRKDIEYMTANYMRNNPVTHNAAVKITEFDPEAIFFFSTYAPSCALIHEINVDRLASKFLFGISFLTDLIRKFCRSKGLEFIISRVTPPHYAGSMAIVDEFHRLISKDGQNREFSVDALEGFIAASLFGEIISMISTEITKEKILEVMKSFENYDFKGLKLNYDPSKKELYNHVWIDIGEKKW